MCGGGGLCGGDCLRICLWGCVRGRLFGGAVGELCRGVVWGAVCVGAVFHSCLVPLIQ